MKKRLRLIIPILLLVIIGGIYLVSRSRATVLRLTGVVTTDAVVVSSEIQGRLQSLAVNQGDAVKAGDLLGRIQPQEWKADMSFYSNSVQQSAAQVTQAEADLKFQGAQT